MFVFQIDVVGFVKNDIEGAKQVTEGVLMIPVKVQYTSVFLQVFIKFLKYCKAC